MTLMSLAERDQENVFRIGVSSAPVTDWKYSQNYYAYNNANLPESSVRRKPHAAHSTLKCWAAAAMLSKLA